MSEVMLSKETEAVIKTLLQLCKAITWRYGVDAGMMVADIADEKEAIHMEEEVLNNFITNASTCVFEYLKEMEESQGGGYIDMGTPRALRLVSEGDLAKDNLSTLFMGQQTIVNKLVLMDLIKTSKVELEKFGNICSQFSGEKRKVV